MPEAAGSRQEYVLEGFPFANPKSGTTFYFALQVRDETGNFSAISNVASLSYEEEVEPEAEPVGEGAEAAGPEEAEARPEEAEAQPEAAAVAETVHAVPEELRRACCDFGRIAGSILPGLDQGSPDK